MTLVLQFMAREPHATCSLPGDARGNTAAHLAAKHGQLKCLQACPFYDVMFYSFLRPLSTLYMQIILLCA